jgi:hypothetical protein
MAADDGIDTGTGAAGVPAPPPATPASPPPPASEAAANPPKPLRSRDPTVFILQRELAEVHLLLDNVSANPNAAVGEQPLVTGSAEDLPSGWIEKVCDITWPPSGNTDERAEDAALLIKAKDHLNRLSYPASGFTIAFTTLVTQGDISRTAALAAERAARSEKTLSPAAANAPPPGAAAAETAPGDDGYTPTRHSLAETAYPDLVPKAESFGLWMRWISGALLAVLVTTCVLSWYEAWGNAQLAELKSLNQAITDLDTTIANAQAEREKATNQQGRDAGGSQPQTGQSNGSNAPAPAGSGGGSGTQPQANSQGAPNPAPTGGATPPVPPSTQPNAIGLAAPELFVGYCNRPYKAVAQAVACETRTERFHQRERVKWRLERWTCWLCGPDPAKYDEPSDAEISADLASTNPDVKKKAEWDANIAKAHRAREKQRAWDNKEGLKEDAPARASTLANILGSAVLPFLYGLLGAAAAVIRSLSKKIRGSLLSPRDLTLSLQQLALGAVTGACIGLFIGHPGDGDAGDTLLGPVALSGPAISFVAGFGVEAVFQALEELIKRIFNVTPAGTAMSTNQSTRTVVIHRTITGPAGTEGEPGGGGEPGGKDGPGSGGTGAGTTSTPGGPEKDRAAETGKSPRALSDPRAKAGQKMPDTPSKPTDRTAEGQGAPESEEAQPKDH